MNCKDCEHLHIRSPYKNRWRWVLGLRLAECKKHDAVISFGSMRKINKLTCLEEATLKNELIPCPFCGGKATIKQSGIGIMETNRNSVRFDFDIRCVNCNATAPGAYGYISVNLSGTGLNVWHDDRPSAIESWNRRVHDG